MEMRGNQSREFLDRTTGFGTASSHGGEMFVIRTLVSGWKTSDAASR